MCNLRKFQNSQGTARSLARSPCAKHHPQQSPRRTHSHSRHSITAEQLLAAVEHSEITSETWELPADSLEDYLGSCCCRPSFQRPQQVSPSVPTDPENPTDCANTAARGRPDSAHSDFRCTQAGPLILPHNHSHRRHHQHRPRRSLGDAAESARKKKSANLASKDLLFSIHLPTPV